MDQMRPQARMHRGRKDGGAVKQILINWRNIFFVVFWAAASAFVIYAGIKSRDLFFMAFILFCLIFTIGFVIIFPHYMIVTDEEIKIYYLFNKAIYMRWEDIREISTHNYRLFITDYKFTPMRGRKYFFQSGYFPKSRKLKKLIERYWNGQIS